MSGRLYGVGLGPGDPELVTVKAARLIENAQVIAYHSARHGKSVARSVAAPYLREGQIEEQFVYPVTTETTSHPGGYQGAMDEFYASCAARLAAHLDAGRDVVVLAEGDPFFYGSYMHLHKRLAPRYPATVVPGVTSVSGAAAALGRPLVERDEVLTVLPGTLPAADLASRLAGDAPAVVMKLGRTFGAVREALESAGRLGEAWYVERATTAGERVAPLAEVDPETVPYFSVAVLPSRLSPGLSDAASASGASAGGVSAAGASAAGASGAGASEAGVSAAGAPAGGGAGAAQGGEVVVVGLGPGGRDWQTPESQAALAAADELVGYGPYLDRVPANPRQRRHPSDNRVEAERAAFALDLAARGARVAVVSSGDPGVFAMAAAVLEVAEEPRWKHVPVRVVPGITAAQAVASRVGAPLGHDFCILSLSDRLKPWDVIASRLAAAAAADFVIAIYNPASKSRREQIVAAKELLLEHRDADTPVVIGRDVGGPTESVRVVRLGDLDTSEIDMRTLLLVGSSQTRSDGHIVYTPRRYPA